MKIKLAMLDKDSNYLSRVSSVLSSRFADKLEIYAFSDGKAAIKTLEDLKIDVFISSDAFEIDVGKLSKKCGFAYFVESPAIESLYGQRAICKFQKVELIYKEVLSLYSENVANSAEFKLDGNSSAVMTFTSVSGGVGSSAVAAAFSIALARRGKTVLYLNMEQFGNSNCIFNAPGQFDFSDVIYAVKSKKSNLGLKLESTVKQDATGVFFYDPCDVALDMTELSNEDVRSMITQLMLSGTYQYIVIDTGFRFDKVFLEYAKLSSRVIFVSDGSEISNMKLRRAYDALSVYEQQQELAILAKLSLIYNKYSNKTGSASDIEGLNVIGGAQRFEYASYKQVVDQLSTLEFEEKLMDR